MESQQNQRFIDYVRRTSKPAVFEQRNQLLSALTGWTCTSVAALQASVRGNTNTRDWIVRAMRDGEIIRHEDGTLRLPQPVQGTDLERAYAAFCESNLALRRAFGESEPELVDVLRACEETLEDHFDPMPVDAREPSHQAWEGDETITQTEKRLARPSCPVYGLLPSLTERKTA